MVLLQRPGAKGTRTEPELVKENLLVKSCSSTCAGRPTTAQLRSHIKKGGSIRTAQRAFGGKRDNLENRYAEAKGALPDVHVELPEDCVKIQDSIKRSFRHFAGGNVIIFETSEKLEQIR